MQIKKAVGVLLAVIMCSCTTEPSPDLTVITRADTVTEDVGDSELRMPEGMVTKYFSLGFDKRMQDAYDGVTDTVSHMEKTSVIPLTVSTEDYYKVLNIVRCEQLGFFFLEDRTIGEYNTSAQSFEMDFTYRYSMTEVNAMLSRVEEEGKKILELTDASMTDYDKLKIFHDYLVRNVESGDDENSDSIYGALVEKHALCEGYAKAFSYLCNLAGIENMIVTGFTDIDHMWNMVKVDGNWYHVDVGWDRPAEALLEKCPDMVLYQYFLATDEVRSRHCQISKSMGEPPSADSTDLNYFLREGCYADTYKGVLSVIENKCRSCIDSGSDHFMIKLDSEELYDATLINLTFTDDDGTTDIQRIADSIGFRGEISCTDYYKDDLIIIFMLE
ncbi:MAG: hypothetical protein IJ251_03235 [Oscillospiraceae bacterium]|nr:hypothetical protein [Oscillospiraceae bacterium]